MEVPYNTGIYRQMKAEGKLVAPVADWDTKRRWVDEAFRAFEERGYTVTSTTTVVKDPARVKFEYRQGLFSGADLLSIGVASFGHLNRVHYQNHHDFQPYVDAINTDHLPTCRAYLLPDDERYLREFILQLKLGSVGIRAFTEKFGEDPRTRFAAPLATLKAWGFLAESETHLGHDTRDVVTFKNKVIHRLLEKREIRLVFQTAPYGLLVENSISLRSCRADGGALA